MSEEQNELGKYDYEVVYPLDVIQFVSGNKKMYMFLNYLFSEARKFNDANRDEMGDDFFPIMHHVERSFAYEIEFDFFVETYVRYAKEIFGISEDSEWKMFSFLRNNTDDKISKARYVFFVTILGDYYSLGGQFYRDPCKNKKMIYFEKVYKNEFGKFAKGRVIQIKDYYDQHILESDNYLSVREEVKEEMAFGKKFVKKFMEENELEKLQQIYKIDTN